MNPAEVSAVIVTRGDVPLDQILDSITAAGITDVVVWDNSKRPQDLGVYGRYAAIDEAENDILYVQDDDALVPIEKLLAVAGEYDLTHKIVCNMPVSRWDDYPDSALIGWGAVFHYELPNAAFARFVIEETEELLGRPGSNLVAHIPVRRQRVPLDFFYRECDTVFTTLTPVVKADLGFEHLPWAEDPARALFKQPGHKQARDRMLALAIQVRDS